MKGCRKQGMNVVARTDAHAARQDVYDAHPDWIAVDAQGNKRRHPSDPDFWITCALGPYNFDFMTQVHVEIMTKYTPDGIFTNRWAGSGMCYCEHCQQKLPCLLRSEPAPHAQSSGSGAAAIHHLAPTAALRTVAAVE